jgi:pimeloyl-ACP methyl ester carboxylesterase
MVRLRTLVLFGGGLAYRTYRHHELARATAIDPVKGIDESFFTRWANAYEPGQPSAWKLMSIVLFESDAGPRDIRDYARGITTSQDHFREAVEAADLPSMGTDFAIPFLVFQGALDRVTPAQPVRAYVDSITARQNQLVLIPNAGHNVMATPNDEFLSLLVQRVRPLAIQSP